MHTRRLGLAFGLLATLLVAPTASAAPAITTITIDVDFDSGEMFTASGGSCAILGVAVTGPVLRGRGRSPGPRRVHIPPDQDTDLR